MSNSTNQLNQRISNLYGLVGQITSGGGVPTSSNIADVLANGNDAGNLSITNLNDIDVNTINGAAYPPPTPGLAAVLTASNDAGGLNITNLNTLDFANPDGDGVIDIGDDYLTGITSNNSGNLNLNAVAGVVNILSNTGLNLNNTGVNKDITGVNNINLSTINNAAYPPPSGTQDLSQVLGVDNTAADDIILNNLPGGTNSISLLPNITELPSGLIIPEIILTNGTLTNTINHRGYSTKNADAQAGTHYMNFSANSGDGVGAIQKTANISCVPSTGSITLTSLGALNTGVITLQPDLTSGNPRITLTDGTNTNTIDKAGISGNAGTATTAATATAVTTTSFNSDTTCFIAFSSTSSVTQPTQLKLDDTTGPLSYNPSSGTLTTGTLTLSNIPTSATGLLPGQIWRNGNAINIIPAPNTFPLDNLSPAGTAAFAASGAGAYGTKRLRLLYLGPTLQIKVGTSANTDFYADELGNLGTGLNGTGTTLAAFIAANGGGLAYVTTWYDQTINGKNATGIAYSSTNYPILNVSATPTFINFRSGSNILFSYFTLPDSTMPSGNMSYTYVTKFNQLNNFGGIWSIGYPVGSSTISSGAHLLSPLSAPTYSDRFGSSLFSAVSGPASASGVTQTITNLYSVPNFANPTINTISMFLNGVQIGTASNISERFTGTANTLIGTMGGSSQMMGGSIGGGASATGGNMFFLYFCASALVLNDRSILENS